VKVKPIPVNPELDALLEAARAAPPMTEAELRAQRDSWVRGEMAIGLDRQEAAFRATLKEPEV